MSFRAPVADIAFTLKHAAGLKQALAEGLYGDAAAHDKALAMIEAYLATKPRVVSGAAPWALLSLGEPARALALAPGNEAARKLAETPQ